MEDKKYVNITKVYTKRGDKGETDLLGGSAARKDSLKVESYGCVDAVSYTHLLLTTAAGLMIAIPVIVVYNYLNRRLEKMENEIDDVVTNIINIFRR